MNQRRDTFEEILNGDKPPMPSKGKLGKLIGDITRQSRVVKLRIRAYPEIGKLLKRVIFEIFLAKTLILEKKSLKFFNFLENLQIEKKHQNFVKSQFLGLLREVTKLKKYRNFEVFLKISKL